MPFGERHADRFLVAKNVESGLKERGREAHHDDSALLGVGFKDHSRVVELQKGDGLAIGVTQPNLGAIGGIAIRPTVNANAVARYNRHGLPPSVSAARAAAARASASEAAGTASARRGRR